MARDFDIQTQVRSCLARGLSGPCKHFFCPAFYPQQIIILVSRARKEAFQRRSHLPSTSRSLLREAQGSLTFTRHVY